VPRGGGGGDAQECEWQHDMLRISQGITSAARGAGCMRDANHSLLVVLLVVTM
jgi:hypothetical protein